MNKVCFTTTSCCRSDLLERTYYSFNEKLKGISLKETTLFLNLDHYEDIGDVEESISVANIFFGNVIYNVNEEPNFAAAIKWCWCRDFPTPYVFHLEEDWELVSDVNIEDLISVFNDKNKNIVSVRLRHKGRLNEGVDNAIILAPSLFKSKFLNIANYISEHKNPEKEIHDFPSDSRIKIASEMGLLTTRSYVFTNLNMERNEKAPPLVSDIGRQWRGEHILNIRLKPKGVKWVISKPIEEE
jgi:hypothetical protein